MSPSPVRRVIVIGALIAGWTLGCRQAPSTRPPATTAQRRDPPQGDTRRLEYLDVAEAVFRHQFDHNASGAQRNVEYFFISLEKADPPEGLLVRFANEKPRVLPASLAASSAAEGVRHKELGGRGLIFRVSSVRWIDATTAEVQGGYYEAGLSSSGNVYRVERRNGKWTVTKDEMQWIS